MHFLVSASVTATAALRGGRARAFANLRRWTSATAASSSSCSSSSSTASPYAAQAKAATERVKPQVAPPKLDIAKLIADPAATARNAAERNVRLPDESHVVKLAELRARQLVLEKDVIGARTEHAKLTAASKKRKGPMTPAELEAAVALKQLTKQLEEEHTTVTRELATYAAVLPNWSHASSPKGPEDNAVVIETFGPEPLPADERRDHVRIAEQFHWLNPAASALATGASWSYLMGAAALMEHALVGYAMSKATAAGYMPVATPDVVATDVAERCGFQPRDVPNGPRQTYVIERDAQSADDVDAPQLCLTGTAEIPLGALWANRNLPRAALPAKTVGVGRAFRAEAGARGADTRGLYRVHQFTKVELYCVTSAEEGESDRVMEDMRALQKEIARGLGLTVRVLDMPTEELGASASRKYDMEAWMPGRAKWGEITSTSNCTDYQSRRLHTKYREDASPKSKLQYAHTLNGTAAAIPRLIVALIENGARVDESTGEVVGVDLPSVLRPFWIGPEGAGGGDGVIRFV